MVGTAGDEQDPFLDWFRAQIETIPVPAHLVTPEAAARCWAEAQRRAEAEAHAQELMRLVERLREELDALIWFVPNESNAGLVRWAERRSFGRAGVPERDRRAFLVAVARAVREARSVAAQAPAAAPVSTGGGTVALATTETVGTHPEVFRAETSEVFRAETSKALEADEQLWEPFLLREYAGLSAEELARLLERPVANVESALEQADEFARGRGFFRALPSPTPVST